MPTLLGPFFPPGCSPKGSLVAIRVMKHPATGGHALGTRSAAATASAHPHPVRPPARLRAHRHGGPPARTPPRRGGSPGQSSQPSSTQPRADRAGSQSFRPRTPSHLPYHSIPPPRLDSRGPGSETERCRTQGAGRAALVLAVVLRHGRSANAGDGAGRGQAPLAAPRPLAPSPAWRGTGKLAKAGGRVGAPGRERVPGPG